MISIAINFSVTQVSFCSKILNAKILLRKWAYAEAAYHRLAPALGVPSSSQRSAMRARFLRNQYHVYDYWLSNILFYHWKQNYLDDSP